jgi:hypothetical protein
MQRAVVLVQLMIFVVGDLWMRAAVRSAHADRGQTQTHQEHVEQTIFSFAKR